jgi:hypothetical protein
MQDMQDMQEQTRLVPLVGERFLSLALSIESQLSVPLYAFVQRPYDEALCITLGYGGGP